jgi:hypothetical protein
MSIYEHLWAARKQITSRCMLYALYGIFKEQLSLVSRIGTALHTVFVAWTGTDKLVLSFSCHFTFMQRVLVHGWFSILNNVLSCRPFLP